MLNQSYLSSKKNSVAELYSAPFVLARTQILQTAAKRKYIPTAPDGYSFGDILCDLLYFPIRRVFIMGKENHTDQAIQKEKKLLKLYLAASIGSFLAFVIFVLILIGSNWLSKISPVGLIVRVIAWPLTVLAAICCVAAVFTSAVRFLWTAVLRSPVIFLWSLLKGPPQVKTPPQKTPDQEAADEGRDD